MASPNPRAQILSIGSELTAGAIADTNAAWLAASLVPLGIVSERHTAVGDQHEAIVAAVRAALGHCRVLLITGGLGPTQDDLTRQAVADALGRRLVRNRESGHRLQALFLRHGWTRHPGHEQQLFLPRGARPLPNKNGTADGFILTQEKTVVLAMPGVPVEMMVMFQNYVAPALSQKFKDRAPIVRKVIRLYGATESYAESLIHDLMNEATGAQVGIRVTDDALEVSIASPDRDLVRRVEKTLRRRLGERVFGTGGQTLEAAVLKKLRRSGATVALAESCTGGKVSDRLTDVPGASNHLLESVVCYSNRSKTNTLGVPAALIRKHGAVSTEVATAMAVGIRKRAGADFGVGITGIAGPGGGSRKKPVGLVYIAIAGPSDTNSWRHLFAGDRHTVKQRAANAALNRLRLAL